MENTSNKTDYQKTLNLPQTDFAMKAGLSQKEPRMLERWQKDELYKSIRRKEQRSQTFYPARRAAVCQRAYPYWARA